MYSWQEAMLFNTTEIVARSDGAEWTGTGFFVQHGERLLLVSNTHVLEDRPDVAYSITLHRQASTPTGIFLENHAGRFDIDYANPLALDFKTANRFYAHPDPTVDLAVVDLSDIAPPGGTVVVPLSAAKILDWTGSQLTPAQQVMFVGYPQSISDETHHLPVVRTGTIASLPMLDFGGEPIFLIDAQIWDGSSGSPVYVSAKASGGTFSLIGIIRSSLDFNRNGVSLHLGLGHAVKSAELLAILCRIGP